MGKIFRFFLRLFLCFVVAKLILQAVGAETREYLVGLTAVFLVNFYAFNFLEFRDRFLPPRPPEEAQPPQESPGAGETTGEPSLKE